MKLPTGWKAEAKEHTHSTGKSHEKTIAVAEGLPMGRKRSGAHDKVRDAKHDGGNAARAARSKNESIENGGADPCGGC